MNAGEGTASGKNVGHHCSIFCGSRLCGSRLCRSVFRELDRVADDGHAVADRAQRSERAIQKCLAAKIQEGFVGAHTGTLASGQQKRHARQFGSCHMGKHKSKTAIDESNLSRTAKPSEDGCVRLVREHYSSSCRKNSWMFSCWDAVRTSFPGRAARRMESFTRSAWCARPLTSTIGRPCVAEIGSITQWRRRPPSDADPVKYSRPGCPGHVGCGRSFRFDTAGRILVRGTRV